MKMLDVNTIMDERVIDGIEEYTELITDLKESGYNFMMTSTVKDEGFYNIGTEEKAYTFMYDGLYQTYTDQAHLYI